MVCVDFTCEAAKDTNRRHLVLCDPLACHRLQYGHRKLSNTIIHSVLHVLYATMETLQCLLLLCVLYEVVFGQTQIYSPFFFKCANIF